MTIGRMLDNAKALRSGMAGGQLVRLALVPYQDDIIGQQRIQLLEGKSSSGQDMHPFYSEDLKPSGWFHTKESAQRYADWKRTISYPYTVKRNPDAPNLYITGVFHGDLQVSLGADAVAIVPDTGYAANIMAKYGRGAFGLSRESWGVIFREKGAGKELSRIVRSVLCQ